MAPRVLQMELLEAQQRKPFREILIDLYTEHGSIAGTASALGITRQTLWFWMKFTSITTDELKVERDRQRASANSAPDG